MFIQERISLTSQGLISQAIIAGIIGIVLGIYTLGLSFLPHQWLPLFLLAALCPFIAMVVGNIRRLLLAAILLDIPLQADVNLFYHNDLAKLGAEAGLTISISLVCLVVLYALWLSDLLKKTAEPPRPWLRLSLPLALYLTFVILSVGVAHNVLLSLFEISMLLQVFLLWIYIVATTRSRQDVLFIITVLLIGFILESTLMIAAGFAGKTLKLMIVSVVNDRGRVGGTLGSPILAAGFLYLLLTPVLSILLTQVKGYYKWLAAFAFGLGGLALLLTFSRAGWFAFFFSSGALSFFAWRRGWLSLTLPIILIVVTLMLGMFFQDAILGRIFGDDNDSAAARPFLMHLAFNMIKDNLLGVGANNFAVRLMQYATFDRAGVWLYTVHNKYLLVWAETGIGGLGAYLWFLLATLRRGWQCWKFKDRFLSPLALALSLALMGNMIHMLVDVFHSRSVVQLLWLISGLITAMYSIACEENAMIGKREI